MRQSRFLSGIQIVNQILPYISVGLDNENRCIVVVEDYELFDLIDDFLGEECDLLYESRTTKERPGGEIITMYFPLAVTREAIERNLLKLSPEEIERIYRLNNQVICTAVSTSASGRKQPVPAPASVGGVTTLSGQGRSVLQLFRYPCRSVAAIQRKFVAAIGKICWTQPFAAIPFVASIPESYTTR